MKLVSNKKKKIIIAAVAGVIVSLAIIIGLIVGLSSLNVDTNGDEDPMKERGIIVSKHPNKTTYYIGEEFEPTGTKIQVLTNSQATTYFVDETELTFSGFDSSVTNEKLVITVTYKEFTATFTVSVKERPSETPVLTAIRLSDNFTTTYTVERWNKFGPKFRDVKLICTYSDGTEKEIDMVTDYAYGVNTSLNSAGTTQFTVKYNEGGIEVSTTVTVTITN